MSDAAQWFHPAGTRARDGWDVVVDATLPGWTHTGLRVATIAAGEKRSLESGGLERIVVPLAGSFDVVVDGTSYRLHGRGSVFDGPTDVLFAGRGAALTVAGDGRVAVAEAVAHSTAPTLYIAREDVPVEQRGAGRSSRQVHNFGTPGVLAASSLIACEVLTPGGNWSSFPAHKHDEERPGAESRLEEIYYFEAEPETGGAGDAFGMFAAHSSPAGSIEMTEIVRSGDVALVPFGYHGPAAAAPGSDLYYLNVMAGPGPRAWLIADDPAQAWVRASWETMETDPRLPYDRTPTEGS